jgi:hypothetical protein
VALAFGRTRYAAGGLISIGSSPWARGMVLAGYCRQHENDVRLLQIPLGCSSGCRNRSRLWPFGHSRPRLQFNWRQFAEQQWRVRRNWWRGQHRRCARNWWRSQHRRCGWPFSGRGYASSLLDSIESTNRKPLRAACRWVAGWHNLRYQALCAIERHYHRGCHGPSDRRVLSISRQFRL